MNFGASIRPTPMDLARRSRELYVNLPVANLARSKAFFAALGFDFEPRFTNDDAACMIVGETSFVMLLRRPFFEGFSDKKICDGSSTLEALFAFDAPSRAEVDATFAAALAAGAREARPAKDHGFMYERSFYDLDDHLWEVLWMDVEAAGSSAT